MLNYQPEGRRNIGRPQKRWEDDFREEGTGQKKIRVNKNSNHKILNYQPEGRRN